MTVTLLSLPDDVLGRVVKCLLPCPSSDSASHISMKHVVSLSETCSRFRAVVVQQLHIIDFLAPSSYTSLCCRTTQAWSTRIESLIQSAGHYLRILHLPHGYIPQDATHSALRSCFNLRELSLPVKKDLDANQVHTLFSCFPSLERLTLDLASPQFLQGLCSADISLKEVALTKLPAKTAVFNALSSFLKRKGPQLSKLRLDFLTEDTRWDYLNSLNRSWVYHELLMRQEQVILRLSAIFRQLSEERKLSSLRELDVSTIPDFSVRTPSEIFWDRSRDKIFVLRGAVKSAREENPHIKGLEKLRIRAPSKILHPSIAFMSPWIDPMVDVTFSFPDCTLRLPHNASTEQPLCAELKEVLLGNRPFDSEEGWNCQSPPALFMDVGRENVAYVETITFGENLETIPEVILQKVLKAFAKSLTRFGRASLKTVRFVCNIHNTDAVANIVTCLRVIDMVPFKLQELELPADIVMFSALIPSLALISGQFVTTIRISDFRNTTILEGIGEAGASHLHYISEGPITGSTQKAIWFLKGLPKFLSILVQHFPMLETLYMEQTSATHSIRDQAAISRALGVIQGFENASRADASTLTTEISAWNEIPLPV